jgi:hypothetical protein
MTLIGWILTLVVGGVAVLVVLRLFPIYVEAMKVGAALDGIVAEPGIADMGRPEIERKFLARMNIEDVDRLDSEEDLRGHFFVEKRDGRVVIRVQYQALAPLFGNLSLVADWRREASYP